MHKIDLNIYNMNDIYSDIPSLKLHLFFICLLCGIVPLKMFFIWFGLYSCCCGFVYFFIFFNFATYFRNLNYCFVVCHFS